jgi:hypothetical protein
MLTTPPVADLRRVCTSCGEIVELVLREPSRPRWDEGWTCPRFACPACDYIYLRTPRGTLKPDRPRSDRERVARLSREEFHR